VSAGSATPESSGWKLKPPHDAMTQGIVVSGFAALPFSRALFLFCDWPENEPDSDTYVSKGGWLKTLKTVAPITSASGSTERAAIIAFSWTGLRKSGLGEEALASFSLPFREGMYQEDRLRRLGDRVKDKWQGTVIAEGPRWSGNTPARGPDRPEPGMRSASTAPDGQEAPFQVRTPITVHALLLLYAAEETALAAWADQVTSALVGDGVRVVHELALSLQIDPVKRIVREHFGFADGLSQPIPFSTDAAGPVVSSDGKPMPRDRWHGVPLGEVLLGHPNAHAEPAPGPLVPDLRTSTARETLPVSGAPEGFLNFGLNGSYMVVRELRQYVADFWNSLEANAGRIRAHDPSATHVTADWLAERIVGRTVDGHLLCPAGMLPPDGNGQPQNAFGFAGNDLDGQGCPAGSHVRRANPRDGLAPDPAEAQVLLDAANNHRILRRGRKFGDPAPDRFTDDKKERGLLFVCLNSDISRQFEFVQQTWILNRNFATLFDETDPLIGPKGPFTIREQPLRRIVNVETFVQMAGGEYFFLPSLPALDYLAGL